MSQPTPDPAFPSQGDVAASLLDAVGALERLASRVIRPSVPSVRSWSMLHALNVPINGGPLAAVVERDLNRYHSLLDEALAGLRFSEAEALMIVDVCRSWIATSPDDMRQLWMEVEAGCDDDLGPEACKALVAKLRALSSLEAVAVVDAAQRAWVQQHSTMAGRMRAAGLLPPA